MPSSANFRGKRTFFITLTVMAVLIGLWWMPGITIGNYTLRRVDILADVMRDSSDVADSLAEESLSEQQGQGVAGQKASELRFVAYVDSVPKGMVPIEDFRDSLGQVREMDKFYAALDHAKDRPVRIAYFGDSFIEGDILTAHLRHFLQERYGGCGVGFIDIKSPVAGFRTTVRETSTGWQAYSAVGGTGFNADLQGINSRYFLPMGTAHIDVRCQQRVLPQHLDTAQIATVYFDPVPGLTMRYSLNGNDFLPFYECDDDSIATDSLKAISLRAKIGKVDFEVNGCGRFYGMALDGRCGIVLDNFSMRGSMGWHLAKIPMQRLRQFAALRNYDLIIMHYGLNVSNSSAVSYGPFCEKLKPCVEHFREAFPNASLLVVSVSNRDARMPNGDFQSMVGVKELVEAQRRLAEDERIAFWNIQQGMGGSGSMARLQKEGKANRDYTHINFAGGEVLGRIFFDALMNGKWNYDRRRKLQTAKE